MASPSIKVAIYADLAQLGQAFSKAGDLGQSAAKGIHGAFSSVLGALNTTGVLGPFGEALGGIDEAIGQVAEHGKAVGPAMMGVGAALAGVGIGLSTLASKDQAAHQQLQQAVNNTGQSYDTYAGKVDAAIKHEEKFGDTASQTQDALRLLTTATNDPAKALSLLGEATDLAAAKHESLQTAAQQLGMVFNGNTRILKQFGVETTNTATTAKQLAADTTAAQNAADAHAKALQHLSDVHALLAGKTKLTTQEQITLRDATQNVTDTAAKQQDAANKLATAQQGAAGGANAHSAALDQLGQKLKGEAAAQADTFTGKLDAMKARFEDLASNLGAKYGPAITAIGSVMSGVGAASEVMSAIMAASWFAAIWPVALVIAAVAAVGIAIYLFRDKIKEVFDWIVKNWPLLVDIIAGPIGIAATQIYEHWAQIENFFKGIPGDMKRIFDDIWSPIADAFKDAINNVIDLWNSLKITLPKVDVGPVHLGGETIGVPTVPHLAQGGLITQSGLVYAHAGEAITPIPGGALGPAVHIENATFSSEADVDMLLRKAEFAVSAGRI